MILIPPNIITIQTNRKNHLHDKTRPRKVSDHSRTMVYRAESLLFRLSFAVEVQKKAKTGIPNTDEEKKIRIFLLEPQCKNRNIAERQYFQYPQNLGMAKTQKPYI